MRDPPDLDGSGYFLYHSIGMFPGKAERIGSRACGARRLSGALPTTPNGRSRSSIRNAVPRSDGVHLIGAPAGTMTTAENVTTALYSIIGSLPDRYLKGRKLLIAADCFPSLHFLLSGMAERRGFIVQTVPMRPGEDWVRDEDFIARLGAGSRRRAADVGHLHRLASLRSARTRRARPRARLAGGCRYHAGRWHRAVRCVSSERGLRGGLDAQVAVRRRGRRGTAGAREAASGVSAGAARLVQPGESFRLGAGFSSSTPAMRAASITARHRFSRLRACLPALDWHASQNSGVLEATTAPCARRLIEGCAGLGLELVEPGIGGRTRRQRDVSSARQSRGGGREAARTTAVHRLPGKYPADIPRQRDGCSRGRASAPGSARAALIRRSALRLRPPLNQDVHVTEILLRGDRRSLRRVRVR